MCPTRECHRTEEPRSNIEYLTPSQLGLSAVASLSIELAAADDLGAEASRRGHGAGQEPPWIDIDPPSEERGYNTDGDDDLVHQVLCICSPSSFHLREQTKTLEQPLVELCPISLPISDVGRPRSNSQSRSCDDDAMLASRHPNHGGVVLSLQI